MPLNTTRADTGVVTLEMQFAPVNAIATPLRLALLQALMQAEADPAVTAVVITGAQGFFSAGADLVEFNEGRCFDYPSFHAAVLPFLHGMRKPVVAAINGRAIGGGFELALWCHARVAANDAPVGLPETTLGLMPGAGGTQLLPRALGLELATSLIVGGVVQPAAQLAGTALFDQMVPPDQVLPVARQLAAALAARGQPLPHLARLPVQHPQPQGFLQFARTQAKARRDFVPGMLLAIDALAMTLKLPAIEGLPREFEMFRPLVGSPEACAIRHVFFAERAAGKVADLPADITPQPVQRVAVLGAGYMGSGIAHCLARAGLAVTLHDVRPGVAARAVAQLQQVPELASCQLTVADSVSALGPVDLVIEAVVEDATIKQNLFRQLGEVLPAGTLLASNTSTLDLNALAAASGRPGEVVGMHFFGPAPVMRLLEVVRGRDTAPRTLATALALAKRLRKVPVVARVAPGFIANRIYGRFMAQALQLAALGVPPASIDTALERWGWRMGPFRTMDLIGNDLLVSARLPGTAVGPGEALQDRLVAAGRLGQKAGKGWYDYAADPRKGVAAPEVLAWLPAEAPRLSASQIAERCWLALVGEAVQVLEAGIAQRAADIDVSFVLGYGFPRLKGGPLFQAERLGLPVVVQKLEQLQRDTGDPAWAPGAWLLQLARTTGCFPGA